jgi:hypothetical protein
MGGIERQLDQRGGGIDIGGGIKRVIGQLFPL